MQKKKIFGNNTHPRLTNKIREEGQVEGQIYLFFLKKTKGQNNIIADVEA